MIDITPGLPAPQVVEQSDYLPFGTKTVNPAHASMQANRWRYAGKEEQDFGSLNLGLLDFGARMYDPFTARWTAVDPMAGKYTSYSPFNYCGENPIGLFDPDGRTIYIYYGQNNSQVFIYTGKENEDEIPDDYYVKAVIEAYKYNKKNWEKAGLDGQCPSTLLVESNDIKVSVFQDEEFHDWYYMDNGRRPCIIWNPNEGCRTSMGVVLSPATLLSHEADHALDDLKDADNHYKRVKTPDSSFDNKEEQRVILGSERKTAFANGEIKKAGFTRKDHKGMTVFTSSSTTVRFDSDKSRDYRKHKKY